MCKLGEELRSGHVPAILYADDSDVTKEMRALLKSAGVKFNEENAAVEELSEPLLIADGSFLDLQSVKEILALA